MNNTMKFLGFLGLLTILFFSFSFKATNNVKTIVIDAGHGGNDLGANHDGINESEIVKNIAEKISQLSNQNDIKIILLRNTDEFISLDSRVEKVNEIKPDLMLSLHVNASTNHEQNGVDALISKNNRFYEDSKDFALKLIDQISNSDLENGKVIDVNTKLLKESNCPSVTLELGFLSNEKNRAYISSENGQTEVATRILAALK